MSRGRTQAGFRGVRLEDLETDLDRMRRFEEGLGVPCLADYYERIRQGRWLRRNPGIFHLYEADGELVGFLGMVPIHPQSYLCFLRGERYPYFDAQADDILTPGEEASARLRGIHIWIEAFSYRDGGIRTRLTEHAYGVLSRMNLVGLIATSSGPASEEGASWLGLREARTVGPSMTGVRKLWYADPESVGPAPERPLGDRSPVRALFIGVREWFQHAPEAGLTPAEQHVAELYYLRGRKRSAVARALGVSSETVKTHLEGIRRKVAPAAGSPEIAAIATWLHEHPYEVLGQRTE